MPTRSRLAPTPSGYLHYGNLYNFTLTWIEVRRRGGTLLLRIDDLDAIRARDAYIEDIFDTLTALGFDWDEGPRSAADFKARHSQTLRTLEYRKFLDGFPGYACECSRQQIRARTSLAYDGHCRGKGLPLVTDRSQWRLQAESPENDIVLWRKEGLPAYHLVSLKEDLDRGINLIVRGEDLRESTAQQKFLARFLGEAGRPFLESEFRFHPLLMAVDGRKLSKSEGSHSLRHELRQGRKTAEIFQQLARMSGRPDVGSLADALRLW